jgi:putative glutamine amidotransferase
MRPVVGITLGDGDEPGMHAMREDYVRSVEQAGGIPVVLPPDLPILAICRGHQVLNVATGGTLVQDIASTIEGAMKHEGKGPRSRLSHRVDVTAGSRLRGILEQGTIPVNSIHHQAVDRLGDGLVASARCPDDGIVEGLEMPGRRFVVGVQWHPESFWNRPETFQPLFDAHAEACRSESPVRALGEVRSR